MQLPVLYRPVSAVSAKRSFTVRHVSLALATLGVITLGGYALLTKQTVSEAQAAATPPAPHVSVALVTPDRADFASKLAASGSVRARDELIVGADVSGVRLLEVRVEAGSHVKRGDLLARADDAQLRAKLAQQLALVAEAEAAYAQAQAQATRAEQLRESGVYSTEVIEARISEARAAQARLQLARAQRAETEIQLAHTRILAPADGIISSRSATQGAVVQSGGELFRLIRHGELEWLAELPGHSIGRIRPGAVAQIHLGNGKSLEAPVRLVEPSMNPSTRVGLVHIVLPASSGLRAGDHARGEILLERSQALAVPEAAVFNRDGYAYVYVVGADAVARRTRIEAGQRQNGWVEVRGGLHDSAQVIGTGAGFVKDGEKVRVVNATPGVLYHKQHAATTHTGEPS